MIYTIVFTPEAASEVRAIADFIAVDAPLNAERWYAEFSEKVRTLAMFPSACPKAVETRFENSDLRQLPFKSHRIIFRVEESNRIVRILHVRHAARRALGEPEDERPFPDDSV